MGGKAAWRSKRPSRECGLAREAACARNSGAQAPIIQREPRRPPPESSAFQPVLAQLLAQRGAVDAQHRSGAALVAFAVAQDLHEQRDLQLAQCDLVEVLGPAAIEVAQVAAH